MRQPHRTSRCSGPHPPRPLRVETEVFRAYAQRGVSDRDLPGASVPLFKLLEQAEQALYRAKKEGATESQFMRSLARSATTTTITTGPIQPPAYRPRREPACAGRLALAGCHKLSSGIFRYRLPFASGSGSCPPLMLTCSA